METPLHSDVTQFSFLLGTWRGRGEGHYPTIPSFAYFEEVSFAHVGKPFVSYTQKTRDATTELPLHAEAGYLRPGLGGIIEFVVVQPSGIIEMHTGTLDGHSLRLDTLTVLTTPSAKTVTQVRRLLRVEADTLTYELSMAAVGQAFQQHLEASLQRVG